MTTLDNPTTEGCCGVEPEASGCTQGFLGTHMAPFTLALENLDQALNAARTVDAKTDELIRFALSIKARSEPCVRKHFVGAKAAGATEAEIGYVFALTMREAAGADDCWTHGIISSLVAEAGEEPSGCCG